MHRDHTIGQLYFPLEVEGFQEHIQLEIILQDSTRAYYKKRVNLILTQKRRGINWILPVAPCDDDIQFYLEIVFSLMMFWYNFTQINSQKPILKAN